MGKNIGKLLAGLAVIVVLAVIFMRGDQLQHLIDTIEKGTPFFLVLAVVFQMAKYFSQGLSFGWCFRAVNARLPYRTCLKLVFQTYFLDTVIPSLNISGTAIVVEEASRRGIEPGRSIGAALLRQVTISASFVVIMIVGFAFLAFIGRLETGWIVLGCCAILIVGALVGAMVLAALKPQWLLRAASPFLRLADRVLACFKKQPVDGTVRTLVGTYSSSAKLMARNRGDIGREFGFSLLANALEVGCFACAGMAFGMFDFRAVICVYVVTTLSGMISIVPQGVGIVEGASLVAFALFGVQQATAMAIIMVYRAIIFWLPFLIGALLMQKTEFRASGGLSSPKGMAQSLQDLMGDEAAPADPGSAEETPAGIPQAESTGKPATAASAKALRPAAAPAKAAPPAQRENRPRAGRGHGPAV